MSGMRRGCTGFAGIRLRSGYEADQVQETINLERGKWYAGTAGADMAIRGQRLHQDISPGGTSVPLR